MDMSTVLVFHAGFALIGNVQINPVSFHPIFACARTVQECGPLLCSLDLDTLLGRQSFVPSYGLIVIHKRTPPAGVLCDTSQLGLVTWHQINS